MDVEHSVIAVPYELARFDTPQINAVTTSFLYVLPPFLRPGRTHKPCPGIGRNDAAKLRLFYNIARKKFQEGGFLYSTTVLYDCVLRARASCTQLSIGGSLYPTLRPIGLVRGY